MLSYRTIFDGQAIHIALVHQSNNIYIFTWLKHLKLVKAYTCKIKIGKNMLSTKILFKNVA